MARSLHDDPPGLGESVCMRSLRSSSSWVFASAIAVVGSAAVVGCNDNRLESAAQPPTPTTITETYTQGGVTPPVDVLWIIDNSGSMSDDQASLAAGFSAFAPYLQNLNLDFHLAVVTSDMDDPTESGRLIGSPLILDANTPNLEAAFAANAQVGSQGSGVEQGLAAIKAALSDPLLSGPNAGFLRPDAILEVVILSDEDDHSLLPGVSEPSQAQQDDPTWCNTNCVGTGNYVGFLLGLKGGNAAKVNVSAIVTTDSGCAGVNGSTIGSRYVEVANELHGAVGSICSDDYTPLLDQIGSIVASLATAFPLGAAPDPSSITVTVNGQTVPEDAQNGWQYDPNSNSITFAPSAVPPGCAQVQIQYTAADGSTTVVAPPPSDQCPAGN